jgi:hypothetical protein
MDLQQQQQQQQGGQVSHAWGVIQVAQQHIKQCWIRVGHGPAAAAAAAAAAAKCCQSLMQQT